MRQAYINFPGESPRETARITTEKLNVLVGRANAEQVVAETFEKIQPATDDGHITWGSKARIIDKGLAEIAGMQLGDSGTKAIKDYKELVDTRAACDAMARNQATESQKELVGATK